MTMTVWVLWYWFIASIVSMTFSFVFFKIIISQYICSFQSFFNLFPCSHLAVKDCQNVDFWRCGGIQWYIQVCQGVDEMRVKSGPLICRTRSRTGFCCQMMTGPLSTSSSTVRLEKSASAKCWHRLHQRTSTRYDWLILIYQFCRVLFSALMQTHCTLVACDCKWVTVAFYMAHISISTEAVDLQHFFLFVTWVALRETPAIFVHVMGTQYNHALICSVIWSHMLSKIWFSHAYFPFVCVCVCLYSFLTSVFILDNYLSHSSLSERLTAEETQPMRLSGSQSCDRLLTAPPASLGTCPTTSPSPSTRTPPQTSAPSVALILISPLRLRLVVCL